MTEAGRETEPTDPYAYLKERPTRPGESSYLPPATEGEEATSRNPTGEVPPTPAPIPEPPVEPAPPAAPTPVHTDDDLGLTGPMKGMTRRELRAARARREAELASGAIPQVDPDASTPAPEPQAPEEGSSRRGRRSMLRPWGSPSAGAAAPPQAPPQAPGADSSATGVIPPPPPGSPTGSPPPADPTDTSELSPWQPESSQPTAPPKRRGVGFTIAIGIVVLVVAGVVWAVLRLSGTEPDPGATAAPSSTATATDAAGQTPLLTMLPSEVEGGANSEDPGPSGVIYSLSPPGWAPDPNEPEAALESYAGIFTGGEEPVTLTASRFGSAADAEAFATELAGTRGTVIDEGYAFAADQRGHYWIFNNDGLVSIIWFDGELGAYSVVAESSEAALDFYHGLTF